MWTKISKTSGSNGPTPGSFSVVQRYKKGQAVLSIPKALAGTATRADVYSDGNGRLAFMLGHDEKMEFAVYKSSSPSRRSVSIPVAFSDRLPFGSTRVDLEAVAGMLVLDLSKLPKARAAA